MENNGQIPPRRPQPVPRYPFDNTLTNTSVTHSQSPQSNPSDIEVVGQGTRAGQSQALATPRIQSAMRAAGPFTHNYVVGSPSQTPTPVSALAYVQTPPTSSKRPRSTDKDHTVNANAELPNSKRARRQSIRSAAGQHGQRQGQVPLTGFSIFPIVLHPNVESVHRVRPANAQTQAVRPQAQMSTQPIQGTQDEQRKVLEDIARKCAHDPFLRLSVDYHLHDRIAQIPANGVQLARPTGNNASRASPNTQSMHSRTIGPGPASSTVGHTAPPVIAQSVPSAMQLPTPSFPPSSFREPTRDVHSFCLQQLNHEEEVVVRADSAHNDAEAGLLQAKEIQCKGAEQESVSSFYAVASDQSSEPTSTDDDSAPADNSLLWFLNMLFPVHESHGPAFLAPEQLPATDEGHSGPSQSISGRGDAAHVIDEGACLAKNIDQDLTTASTPASTVSCPSTPEEMVAELEACLRSLSKESVLGSN